MHFFRSFCRVIGSALLEEVVEHLVDFGIVSRRLPLRHAELRLGRRARGCRESVWLLWGRGRLSRMRERGLRSRLSRCRRWLARLSNLHLGSRPASPAGRGSGFRLLSGDRLLESRSRSSRGRLECRRGRLRCRRRRDERGGLLHLLLGRRKQLSNRTGDQRGNGLSVGLNWRRQHRRARHRHCARLDHLPAGRR